MGEVLAFQPRPKLSPGERPKRRTDAERLAEMDWPQQADARLQESLRRSEKAQDLITFAKQGAPPESA